MKIRLKHTLHLVEQVTNLFNTKCIASNQSLVWSIAKAARLFQEPLTQCTKVPNKHTSNHATDQPIAWK